MRNRVDANQGERFISELLDERPLVGPMDPSRRSVLLPKVEQHDAAPIITQLELLAVLVLAVDIGGQFSEGQVADVVQLRFSSFRACAR